MKMSTTHMIVVQENIDELVGLVGLDELIEGRIALIGLEVLEGLEEGLEEGPIGATIGVVDDFVPVIWALKAIALAGGGGAELAGPI
jgi:hypothetical protein